MISAKHSMILKKVYHPSFFAVFFWFVLTGRISMGNPLLLQDISSKQKNQVTGMDCNQSTVFSKDIESFNPCIYICVMVVALCLQKPCSSSGPIGFQNPCCFLGKFRGQRAVFFFLALHRQCSRNMKQSKKGHRRCKN